jgi:protein-disulfide isomerase
MSSQICPSAWPTDIMTTMEQLRLTRRRQLTAMLSLTVLIACGSSTSAQPASRQGPNDVVATVGGVPITLAQVDDEALRLPAESFGTGKLFQILFEARRAALDGMIGNLLIDQEAKARGVDRAKLLQEEIVAKVSVPSDAEIEEWYRSNPERVQGATLEQVRAPIKALLAERRASVARGRYLDQLKSKTPVRITLEPPRQVMTTSGGHSQGPADAPIQLVEFADFQCSFCFRAHPTVEKVLATYGNRIRFVYRHFPLSNHQDARPAAEAAECAAEQDKFWPYYQVLFSDPSKLDGTSLRAAAAQVGLDTDRFNQCVDSRKYKSVVDADLKAGEEVGVSGTPAFFVNGRMLSGAQPFEEFKQLIDEELALKAAAR